MKIASTKFQKLILKWFDLHGRKTLPWQKSRNPYRVWISEVMLQQTQVAAVIPYFEKFIKKFPDIKTLAKADLDEVLNLWAGLGFYARARNLHKTAKIIFENYNSVFPEDSKLLQKLPGIGRSTAGAILSLGYEQPAAILDGNVKRLLTRLHALSGSYNDNKLIKQLWEIAEKYIPATRPADYTQALMDLGAMVCTPAQPNCQACPFKKECAGLQTGNPENFPAAKTQKSLPVKATHVVIFCNENNEILLEKRPPTGIWGGLWSLPENSDPEIKIWSKKNYHCEIHKIKKLEGFRHTFSHFHLDITPIFAVVKKWQPPLMESGSIVWYNIKQKNKGLPAPIKKLLQGISFDTLSPLPKTR